MKSTLLQPSLWSMLQRVGFVLLVAILFAAPASAQDAAKPSREKFIEALQTIAKQLEAKKYAETEKYFYLPEKFEHKMFGKLVEGKVISSRGVEALDLGGEYGNADGILRKSDAEEYAARGSISVDQCFAMKMSQGDHRGRVVAHWTGEHFKLLDINDVGSLDPDKVEVTVGAPVKPWPTGNKPTKELLVETLKVFLHRVQAKHYDTLRPNVYVPDDFKMSRFSDSLERDELSTEGIKILTERGSFGKAVEVFVKIRAEILTKRVEVPVDECYGIVAKVAEEQGETLAHWVGDRFKLIRADDIGKLPEALKAESGSEKPATDSTDSTPNVTVTESSGVVSMPASDAAVLPKYETDKNIVMANYAALSQAVAASPKDVSQRARFVQSLLVIGNTPKAWTESVEIYRLDPTHAEVVYAVDQSIEALKKNGIFQVGVPQETIESVMGKPLKTEDVDGIVRWSYPNWNVDFNGGKFIKLSQAKPVAVTK